MVKRIRAREPERPPFDAVEVLILRRRLKELAAGASGGFGGIDGPGGVRDLLERWPAHGALVLEELARTGIDATPLVEWIAGRGAEA